MSLLYNVKQYRMGFGITLRFYCSVVGLSFLPSPGERSDLSALLGALCISLSFSLHSTQENLTQTQTKTSLRLNIQFKVGLLSQQSKFLATSFNSKIQLQLEFGLPTSARQCPYQALTVPFSIYTPLMVSYRRESFHTLQLQNSLGTFHTQSLCKV